jgi:hypothetical protein
MPTESEFMSIKENLSLDFENNLPKELISSKTMYSARIFYE